MKKTLSILIFILCVALASVLLCFGPSRASTNNSEHNTFYEVGVMEKEYGLTSFSNEPEEYIFYGDTIRVSRQQYELSVAIQEKLGMHGEEFQESLAQEQLNTEAVYQMAVKYGFTASAEELEAAKAELIQTLLDEETGGREEALAYLEGLGLTPEEYYDYKAPQLERNICSSKYQESVYQAYQLEHTVDGTVNRQDWLEYWNTLVKNYIANDHVRDLR